ncbi:GspH/FimT family pseudopilin [Ottowia testudinis]|uniref:Type II secretion system protein H n=2 Tax=Ottowia testudinis TaxID=2816950 RepID=A0A975CK28_9BURK|nr:GspH/FimT family pseudopilin [Ottowia testudinis]
MIELMVVISIVAILMALAAPSFRDLINRNRISSTINNLSADYSYAKSEAVRLGGPVTMCVSTDGASCAAAATPSNWHAGWMIFQDDNNDQARQDTEKVLRYRPALKGADKLTADAAAISVNRNGFKPGAAVQLMLRTDPEDQQATRCMVINIGGQQKITKRGETQYGKTCAP